MKSSYINHINLLIMKRIILLFPALLVVFLSIAQDYQLVFHAQGIATQIDSVEIENINQNKSLTIYGQDILHLSGTVGINNPEISDKELFIYPNPATESVSLQFCSEKQETAKLELFDMSGKLIFSQSTEINQGQNAFRLSGFGNGNYIVSLCSETFRYTKTFVSVSNGNNQLRLEQENSSSDIENRKKYEAESKSVISWQYNDGDILIFKAFADGNSRILVYYIVADADLYFDFVLCQDIDGYKYPVTNIGSKTFMAENLHASRYNNNSPVPNVTDNTEWLNLVSGARCYYNNDSAGYSQTYGALYNFEAVNSGVLCPHGWHVATQSDWEQLLVYLQNNGYNYDGSSDPDTDPGTNDKTAKSLTKATNWMSSTEVGAPGNNDFPAFRNRTGFFGIAAGMRGVSGSTTNISIIAAWWSSTSTNTNTAARLAIQYDLANSVISYSADKKFGFSVRCVKD